MVNRHMKRCSALLISRERQINTARRYHLIPIRMGIIRHLMNNRSWRGCEEEGNPVTLLGAHKLVHPLWKTVRQFLKISKNRVSIQSNNSSPEHISGKKNYTLRRFMHPLFTAAKLTIAKTWEQPNCPSRDE